MYAAHLVQLSEGVVPQDFTAMDTHLLKIQE